MDKIISLFEIRIYIKLYFLQKHCFFANLIYSKYKENLNMTHKELWKKFRNSNTIVEEVGYDAWAFGDDPDALADLVVQGKKTATSSAYALYEIEKESLPMVGEYSIILDSKENAVCIIQTTKVIIIPFDEVSDEHAYKEGEGDRSLEYWREVHKTFFADCLSKVGIEFKYNMKVVCEEFKVVYNVSQTIV